MDTTCPQNRTLLISIPASKPSESQPYPIAAVPRRIWGIFASLNVTLGRKTTVVPGMSDKAMVRLAHKDHLEDVMRWNALALQYGGTRIKQ